LLIDKAFKFQPDNYKPGFAKPTGSIEKFC
jgi:hypothetical protein